MRDRDNKNERESVGQTQSTRDFQTNGSASALQYRNYGRDTTAPIAQQPPQPHDPAHEPTYHIIESHCQALTFTTRYAGTPPSGSAFIGSPTLPNKNVTA
jgi:hypothetical protein